MQLCSKCEETLFTPRVHVDIANIRDKLRSEYGPASVDSVQPAEVASILQNIQQDLDDYDVQIRRLDSRRKYLATQRKRLRQYATHVRSLLSPTRNVPDEILRQIFDNCCDTNLFEVTRAGPLENSNTWLRTKPALVLSSVCSRWRRNALYLPSIWARISLIWAWEGEIDADEVSEDEESIDYGKKLEVHAKLFFTLAKKFVDRSGQWPLTIEISLAELLSIDEPGMNLLNKLGPSLQPHRWRSFTLRDSSAFGLLFPDDAPSPSFPWLEYIKIDDWEGEADELKFLTETAPKLQSTRLVHPIKNHPFARLSDLEFRLLNAYGLERLLESCPSLVSLGVPHDFYSDKGYESVTPSASLTLEELTVFSSDCGGRQRFSVFPFLTFPSLKTLRLHLGLHGIWRYFDPFMSFVQRSSFPLTTLSIQSLPLSDSNLIRLLAHVPTLLNLTITDFNIPNKRSPITLQFIQSLHACHSHSGSDHPSAGPVVPRLRSLILKVDANIFEDKSVVDMVRSRWIPRQLTVGHDSGTSLQQVDCLREFTLIFRRRVAEEVKEIYAPLELIEKEGMRLVVLGMF